jgi:hypothetical protein
LLAMFFPGSERAGKSPHLFGDLCDGQTDESQDAHKLFMNAAFDDFGPVSDSRLRTRPKIVNREKWFEAGQPEPRTCSCDSIKSDWLCPHTHAVRHHRAPAVRAVGQC